MRLVLDDWAAHGAAHALILGVRLGRSVLLREVVLARQVGILKVLERAAVPDVGPRLGDRVDDRAGGPAELGVELVGDYLEFLDGFDRGPGLGARPLADDVVVVVAAVQHVVVVARILAVHRDRVAAERFGADRRDDAGEETDEADEVAVDRRQLDELARGDVAADLLGGHVEHRRFRRDVHDFAERPDLERQIDRRRFADLEFHVTAQELLEALQLGTELVSPRHDAADDEGAVLAGDGLAEHAGVLIPHGHRHTRQHRPLGVEHPATDLGRTLLRNRRGDAEHQGEHPRTGLPDHLSCPPLSSKLSVGVRYGSRKNGLRRASLVEGEIHRSGSRPRGMCEIPRFFS
jgi:hypothetical protein